MASISDSSRRVPRDYMQRLAELTAPADAHRQHWHALTAAEQRDAIRRMASSGHTDHGIAHATGLAVEQVRRLLAESGR